MAQRKKTAPAGDEVVAPEPIRDASIFRMHIDDKHPVMAFKGQAPKKGETIRFILDNGVTYAGQVAEITEAGDEVMVEFVDGIAPV